MRERIVGKAATSADFRARLLSDPKGAIEQESDLTIPASMAIKVHEDSGKTALDPPHRNVPATGE